ncbi:MAG: UDP-N-acetylmuramate dehydrogenase [Limnochordales bacterium]|nr:UDP-N-acetylmuramate dehydrogenase [Limnochordales bacterium]
MKERENEKTQAREAAGTWSGLAADLARLVGPGNVRVNEPLSAHTSFRVGGPADCMVFPRSEEQVEAVLRFCRTRNIPVLVIGRGSNLLVRDGGVRGVVVKLADNFAQWEIEGREVWAQAGITLRRLALQTALAGLTGLEFASGIPGALGGAVVMNAGAYGGEIKDVLVTATVLDQNLERREMSPAELQLSYRYSILQKERMLVLSARLRLSRGEPGAIMRQIDDLWERRASRQPLEYPSAGSVFKRPPGRYVGPMIQELGLQGFRIGGAEVSQKHAGFIVNRGGATARDILELIEYVRARVRERFGVELEPEVRIVGDP